MSKGIECIGGIVLKDWVVQGMVFGEPTLRPKRSAIKEEAGAASECKVGEMDDNLQFSEILVFERHVVSQKYVYVPLWVRDDRPP